MEKEIKNLNDIDMDKISGGMNSESDIESDKIYHSDKIRGHANCVLCGNDFSYEYSITDPKSFDKKTFCQDCRLKKVKNIMIDPKGNF